MLVANDWRCGDGEECGMHGGCSPRASETSPSLGEGLRDAGSISMGAGTMRVLNARGDRDGDRGDGGGREGPAALGCSSLGSSAAVGRLGAGTTPSWSKSMKDWNSSSSSSLGSWGEGGAGLGRLGCLN